MFDRQSLMEDREFSWPNALNCALASQLAYAGAEEVRVKVVDRWGFDQCEFFDEEETQGFVTWDSDIVLLSYRGTKQLGDWLVNLNVTRASRPYGKIHRGFLGGFESARAEVEQLLQRSGASDKKLWVTGHSLGGALASVMAAELLDAPPVAGIYTFGQPRVVNRRARELFRHHYDDNFFRLVNDDDIVPKVPALLKQVGSIVWFDADGELKESPPGVRADEFGPEELDEEEFAEQQMILRSLKRQINRAQEEQSSVDVDEIPELGDLPGEETRGLLPSVRDHFMTAYIQKIKRKNSLA